MLHCHFRPPILAICSHTWVVRSTLNEDRHRTIINIWQVCFRFAINCHDLKRQSQKVMRVENCVQILFFFLLPVKFRVQIGQTSEWILQVQRVLHLLRACSASLCIRRRVEKRQDTAKPKAFLQAEKLRHRQIISHNRNNPLAIENQTSANWR